MTLCVIGNSTDTFWIAQERIDNLKEEQTTLSRFIATSCNSPHKIIDNQSGIEFISSDSSIKMLEIICPWIEINYYQSSYEPQVHSEIRLCLELFPLLCNN